MSLKKQFKDCVLKVLNGKAFVPSGLVEINRYFRLNEPIYFTNKKENGVMIAISQNFRHGTIITSAKTSVELDKNIKDAILTSFEIPSSYADEANIRNTKENKQESYAIA